MGWEGWIIRHLSFVREVLRGPRAYAVQGHHVLPKRRVRPLQNLLQGEKAQRGCACADGGSSNQRTCQYKNGQKSCGPCPNGYYANGATTCEKDSPCKTNNGGCKGGRACTAVKQTVTCGPCPKGYHAKGTNDCEKDTT